MALTESHPRGLLGGDFGADVMELALGGEVKGFAGDKVSADDCGP